jgi:hypothetical protein
LVLITLYPQTCSVSRDRVPKEPSRDSKNKKKKRPIQRGKDCSVHQQFHAQTFGRIRQKKDVHHGIDQERDENAGDTNHPFEQDSQDIPFCIFEETSA